MKKIHKLFALALALTLALSLSLPAFATDITISGGASNAQYQAYKLLNATDGGDGKFAYTVNPTYRNALVAALNLTTTSMTEEQIDTAIIQAINDLRVIENDVENEQATARNTREFADAVYAQVKNMMADKTSANGKFTGVDQGYYLIVETTVSSADGTDTHSLVMLSTAGKSNVSVTTKESKPTLEKKVQDKNDSTGAVTEWIDSADYDVNDDVPFQLTGTLPADYATYDKYEYTFHDTLSSGLTFDINSNDVKVTIDGVELTATEYAVTAGTDGASFDVKIDDLKVLDAANEKIIITSASKIVVTYSAKLNAQAVIGSAGNPNEAWLEYSNNPYDGGEGTSNSVHDKVIVFTYKIVVNKVDADGNALKNAGFTLYKWNGTTNAWTAVGTEVKGTDMTTFTWERLDDGKYKLEETTVPDGYNKADDVIFTIEAIHEENADNPELKTLVVKNEQGTDISTGTNAVFTPNMSAGSVTTKVKNLSGTQLPETGGMGTTIFYVVGAVLMLGAVILLVTKKKMQNR